MFHEQRRAVPDTPAELRAEYEAALADLVESCGPEAVVAETSLDAGRIAALVEGGDPSLSLREAAEVAAVDPESPDAETIEIEACDHLLLGMSSAVLDVETLAGHVDLSLDPKEIQQKLERRSGMTFAEYVHLQHAIVERMR